MSRNFAQASEWVRRRVALLILCVALISPLFAIAASTWNPTVLVNTEAFQVLDEGDSTDNIEFQFGQTLKEKIIYDRTNNRFKTSRPLFISGGLTVTGATILSVGNSTATADSGLALEVLGVASGSELYATKRLAGSGGLVMDGTTLLKGTLKLTGLDCTGNANDGALTAGSDGTVSCTDDDSGAGGGMTFGTGSLHQAFANRFVNVQGDTMSGGLLIQSGTLHGTLPSIGSNLLLAVAGTASGWTIHANKLLRSSGALVVDGVTNLHSQINVGGIEGQAYNAFANPSSASPASHTGEITDDNDVYVEGALEVDGAFFADGAFTAAGTLTFAGITSCSNGLITDESGVVSCSAGGGAGWSLTGNSGTTPGTNFLGTTDEIDMVFKTFDVEHMRITAGDSSASPPVPGRVGIGTSAPDTKLDVVGTISGSALRISTVNTSGAIIYSSGTSLIANARGSTGNILVARGAESPVWKTPTGSMVWYIDGVQAVSATGGAVVIMPFGMTATSVDLHAKVAPTGAALIVDINKNGATIFATRPQIDDGAKTGGGGASFSITDLPKGSFVTIDVDQVGSTKTGSGLTIMLSGTRKY